MMQPHTFEEKQAVKTQFQIRKHRQWLIAGVAIGIIVLPLLLAKNFGTDQVIDFIVQTISAVLPNLAGDQVAEFTERAVGPAMTGLVVIALLLSFLNWRCPACNVYLGKTPSPDFCPKCGVEFK